MTGSVTGLFNVIDGLIPPEVMVAHESNKKGKVMANATDRTDLDRFFISPQMWLK